jgi:hypothetical protein
MAVGQNGPKSLGAGEIGVQQSINCKQAAHHVMALALPGSNQIMKHGSIIGIP